MKSRIIRSEQRKDRDGNDEVFVHVEIDDGTEIYHRAEWLTKEDVELFLADEKAIHTIASQVADRGVKTRPAMKAQEEHFKSMQIEEVKLETAKKGLETAQVNLDAANATSAVLEKIGSKDVV